MATVGFGGVHVSMWTCPDSSTSFWGASTSSAEEYGFIFHAGVCGCVVRAGVYAGHAGPPSLQAIWGIVIAGGFGEFGEFDNLIYFAYSWFLIWNDWT